MGGVPGGAQLRDGNPMRIDHIRGRSVADTAALAALTRRSAWSVRTLCPRDCDPPDPGYDVDTCTLILAAHPGEPPLLTAVDAERYLGVPAGTVRQWAHRGQLVSYLRDPQGRPLYDAAHIDDLIRRPQ